MAARLSRRTLSRNPAISKRESRFRDVATKTAETGRTAESRYIDISRAARPRRSCAHEICSPFRFMARIAPRNRVWRTESRIKKKKNGIKIKKRKRMYPGADAK